MIITPAKHQKRWWTKAFRFSLRSFRLDRNFSVRRFSVTEAAFLLLLAICASKGLGVLRQSLFNSIFGTGAEATAYYAAFRLPDTIFNLIAGGALTHALLPMFVSYEKERGKLELWRLR
jgi:putative peptidoglycan lipid II flippase